MDFYYYTAQAETGYGCQAYGKTEAYGVCQSEADASPLAGTGQPVWLALTASILMIIIAVYLLLRTKKAKPAKG